jgi:hypothetical protein
MNKPNLQAKYTNSGMDSNVKICKKIQESYKNPIHGGRLIEEIGETKNRKNSMLTDIYKYKNLKSILGYYDLLNVKISKKEYIDIQILAIGRT